MDTRIFLVAPDAIAETLVLDCATAACSAADLARFLARQRRLKIRIEDVPKITEIF